MTKLAIEFMEEGFYVPMRTVSPPVVEPCDLLETVNRFGELRTREDWFVLASLLVINLWAVSFDIAYAISHWGRL